MSGFVEKCMSVVQSFYLPFRCSGIVVVPLRAYIFVAISVFVDITEEEFPTGPGDAEQHPASS